MEHQNTTAGKAVAICFLAIWMMVAIFMSTMLFGIPFVSDTLFVFNLIPLFMVAFGVVFCIAITKSNTGFARSRRLSSGYSISTTGDAMYSESQGAVMHRPEADRRIIFEVPSKCPSCSASLTTEEVEWVGPLQAQCPYCLATIDASERDF